MPVTKEFKTIMAEVSGEIVIKGSRFIAHATPVSAQSAAAEFIASISQRFHDATHNCFAWKIGLSDAAVFRFSDAGEPSGTAGRPILQAAETRDLTNLAVVVTRYFGGTKLGTGGPHPRIQRCNPRRVGAGGNHHQLPANNRDVKVCICFHQRRSPGCRKAWSKNFGNRF